jgi:hypothetical protein
VGAYPDQVHADHDAGAPLCGDGARDEGGLARVRQRLLWIAANLWWWLRQVSGDADYENYMRRGSRDSCAGGSEDRVSRGAISAEEFYLENLRRKHSRINRCC